MATNQVAVELTGREIQLLEMIRQMNEGLDKTEDKLGEARREAARMGREAKRIWEQTATPMEQHNRRLERYDQLLQKGKISEELRGRAIAHSTRKMQEQEAAARRANSPAILRNIQAMAAGYLSVQAALSAIVRSLQDKEELERRAAAASLDVAGAQKALFANLGPTATTAERRRAAGMVANMAAEARIDEAILLQQFGQIVSATSGANLGRRMELAREITRGIAPQFTAAPQELGAFGGAVADVMKSWGTTDPQEAITFLNAIQGQARVTDLGNIRQIVPALASATTGVQNKEQAMLEAAALFAAVGGTIGDPLGAESKTAVANLVTVMGEQLQAAGVEGARGMTPGQRAALIVADPALQARVIPKLKGRGAVKPVLEQFLRGAPIFEQYQDILGALEAGQAGARPARERMLRDMETLTPELRAEAAARNAAVISEQLLREQGGEAGAVRGMLFGTGDRTGILETTAGWARRVVKSQELRLRGGGAEAGIAILEAEREAIEATRDRAGRGVTEEQRAAWAAQLDKLDGVIEQLENMQQAPQAAAPVPP